MDHDRGQRRVTPVRRVGRIAAGGQWRWSHSGAGPPVCFIAGSLRDSPNPARPVVYSLMNHCCGSVGHHSPEIDQVTTLRSRL